MAKATTAYDVPQSPAEEKIAKELCHLLELYRARRKPHDERVREVCEFLLPDREILIRGIDQRGMSTGANVYDDVGTHCLHVWSDGMLGYTASPGYRWAVWRMVARELNKLPEVRAYLQDYGEQMYSEFKSGGLYKALGIFLRDLGAPGTASCAVMDRTDKPHPFYKVFHPVEVFIGENAEGEIDIELREYNMSIRSMLDFFGEEAVGASRVKEAQKNPLADVRVLWALVPRKERIEGLLHFKNKPVAGFYVDIAKSRLLLEEGFDEMPIITARCIQDSGDEYGRSPGSNALRAVKRASIMGMANMLGAQRMVDQPFLAPIELRGKLRTDPGGRGWYNRGEYTEGSIYHPYERIALPMGADVQEGLDEAVKRHFFYHIFMRLLMEQKTQTAFEVAEIIGERAVVLAPIIYQYLHEALDRIISRTAAIAGRAGRLPKPPQIIVDWVGEDPRRQKFGMDVEYMGPLAQAQQRLFKTQGIMGFMESLTRVPSRAAVLDRPDWDEVVEDLAEGYGVPEKDIRTDEQVSKIREQAVRVQQAMQQAEFAKAGAEASSKMAKRPEAGSPLESMLVGSAGAA